MTQQLLPFRPARPNVLIEAGAGTGKTTEIVREVLHLLVEQPDLDPERLVMITFTEKAAAEIGERIRNTIAVLASRSEERGARSDENPFSFLAPRSSLFEQDRYRAACAKHLRNVDKIRSQTIHGFCQSILRAFPLAAGVDPNFRVIEGYERSRLLQDAFAGWLESETLTNPTEERLEDWKTVLEHFTGVDRVQETILELLNKRILLTDEAYSLGDFGDAEPVIRSILGKIREISPRIIETIGDDSSRTILRYLHHSPAPLGSELPAWIEYFAPIAEPLDHVNLTQVPQGLREPLRCLRGKDNEPSVWTLLQRHQTAVALRRLALRFVAHLDGEKQKRGVLDFDDLLLRTAELLDDPLSAESVRGRYDFIFVDEFQDTDRVQARIVDRLTRNKSGEFVHGRLTLVGDPKQSIYAFRHADPETYRDTLQRLAESGAERRSLTRQFRSDARLVEALNVMFLQLFSVESDPNVFRPRYHELTSARETSPDQGPRIFFLRAEATADEDEPEAAEQEARAIASQIRSQIAAGRSYRDFAILLRKMVNLQAFLDVFDRHGIPYVLPPNGAFLETRPVVELLSVLRAVVAPFDLGARVSAARSQYFALDDGQIARGVSGGDELAWKEFETRLAAYRDLSARVSVTQLVDRIVADSQIELVYGLSRGGSESISFLERFRELAVQFELAGGGSVGQFVDELLRRREGPEETQPAPIDDGRDAVRIMTVHAAKGLEFPVVILPELSAQTREDVVSVFTIDHPPRLVFTGTVGTIGSRYLELENERTPQKICSDRKEAEIDRLFYVAVTRAREEVVFVCSPQRLKKSVFWKRIAALFGWEKTGPDCWEARPGTVVQELAVGPRQIPVGFITPQPLQEEVSPSRLMEPILESRLDSMTPRDPIPASSEDPPVDRAEMARRAAAGRNRGAGILLHRFLEVWDGNEDAEPLLQQLALEQRADNRAIDLTRKRIAALARSAIFRRLQEAETLGRELTFYYTDSDGSAVEARLDRLVEEGGRLLVVDFKSGASYEHRRADDRLQVQRYCAEVNRLSGKPCSGLLWYIDAESDEVVEVSSQQSAVGSQ